MGMTLFFKFTGAAMPVAIFTTLGVEPWGRYLTGAAELVCVVLLLSPRMVPLGALLALAVMGGAIGSHLTVLGISLEGIKDNLPEGSEELVADPSLFAFAWITVLCAAIVLVIHRDQLLGMIRRGPSDP
jgi:hypothetical protein